jgi:dTDP-4-dehydrorhamnose reductase
MPGTALVIGASGQVGRHVSAALRARGWRVEGTGHARAGDGLRPLDLLDQAAVRATIAQVRPALCVISGALTNVERCEAEPDLAEALNARAPAVAAEACRAAGGRSVYLSTEYVFDGAEGPYREADPVHPISVYGRTKLEGERGVLAADPGALAVRTTVVFSFTPGDKNFLMQLIERLGAGEPMRVTSDQVSSPTYAPFLGETIAGLATTVSGLLNVAGAEVMDRATFASRAARALGLDPGLIVPVLTSELGQRARRPLQAGLRVERLESLGVIPPGLEVALADVLERRRLWALEESRTGAGGP